MTDFLNYLLNGLSLGCIYALIAVGYSMVYGVIKLINFAHGEFYMFGAFVGYFVLCFGFGGVANGADVSLAAVLVALLAAGLATGLLAVVVERAVYRPLRSSGRIVALLAALGVSLLMQNTGQQTVGAKDRSFPHTFTAQRFPRTRIDPDCLTAGQRAQADLAIVYTRATEGGRETLVENLASRGRPLTAQACERMRELLKRTAAADCEAAVYSYPAVTVTNTQGLILLALLLTTAALYLLVQHTRFGRAMRAVSHDFEAAALMGINVNRVVAGTFFAGAVVAGIGGTLAGGMYYNEIGPLMGLMPGLKAFVAAVFGGIGSVPGALLGGLLLGTSEKLVEAYWSSLYSDAFTFAILILVLLVRPSGLLGRPPSDKM
ncbi:MAG: branched-chain amino acid ABC transporter permease [Planctomycetota bacterium]